MGIGIKRVWCVFGMFMALLSPARADVCEGGGDGPIPPAPVRPPDANDRTFVVDLAPMPCLFRSGGPIIIQISIDRYIGPHPPGGALFGNSRWTK